jgi:UDP-glucose 4-epimerase
VLITGMGSELGTRVTNLFEADPRFSSIVGIDADPPRRRTTRAEFHMLAPSDPADAAELGQVVREVDPTVLVHLGVYEPGARLGSAGAAAGTDAFARATFRSLMTAPSLEHVVVRSGTEVYGRGRGAPEHPDEGAPCAPTSPYGRSLLEVERLAGDLGRHLDVPVASLRLAPVVGPHVPSPLGRHLRLPLVPISGRSLAPFSVLHQVDAAAAIIAATHHRHDGPVNVVGPGAVTGWQAAQLGGHLPVPTLGAGWLVARLTGELQGAPLPPHVVELLVRGRRVDGSHAAGALGVEPTRSTRDTIAELHDWAPVTHLHHDGHVVAA